MASDFWKNCIGKLVHGFPLACQICSTTAGLGKARWTSDKNHLLQQVPYIYSITDMCCCQLAAAVAHLLPVLNSSCLCFVAPKQGPDSGPKNGATILKKRKISSPASKFVAPILGPWYVRFAFCKEQVGLQQVASFIHVFLRLVPGCWFHSKNHLWSLRKVFWMNGRSCLGPSSPSRTISTGEEPDPIARQRVIPRYLIELTIGSTMQHPNKKSQPLRCGHQMNKHLD